MRTPNERHTTPPLTGHLLHPDGVFRYRAPPVGRNHFAPATTPHTAVEHECFVSITRAVIAAHYLTVSQSSMHVRYPLSIVY